MKYKFDSIVNRHEAESLKEMIFKRARERSEAMNEDIQSDIMDIARDSFVSKNNPFSRIAESSKETINEPSETESASQDTEIGFPVQAIKAKLAKQNEIIENQMTGAVIAQNMLTAREELSSRKSFMGALNFLNSQAAISLIRTRADKFEILA